jgi:hypothetical protein
MTPRPPELLGIPIKELARICGISERTARRWKNGTVCPPETALMILRGDLGVFDPEWRGWLLRSGCLVSPEGWELRMPDVLASRLHEAQLAAYRAENRSLKAQVAGLEVAAIEEQPTPDSWDVQILTG